LNVGTLLHLYTLQFLENGLQTRSTKISLGGIIESHSKNLSPLCASLDEVVFLSFNGKGRMRVEF
jgi:hypothetical protein